MKFARLAMYWKNLGDIRDEDSKEEDLGLVRALPD
jgi:hypothetical protein